MNTRIEAARQLVEEVNQENANTFVNLLKGEGRLFTAQEDTLYDYKREFPHSMTDPYFVAIVRLIFAFHNSYGVT